MASDILLLCYGGVEADSLIWACRAFSSLASGGACDELSHTSDSKISSF